MGWATRISEIPFQPAEGGPGEGDGPLPPVAGEPGGWTFAGQQLHQGPGQLLSGAPAGLALEGMPLAVVDRQQAMERLRLGGCGGRPELPLGCILRQAPILMLALNQSRSVIHRLLSILRLTSIHWTPRRWLLHPDPIPGPAIRPCPRLPAGRPGAAVALV